MEKSPRMQGDQGKNFFRLCLKENRNNCLQMDCVNLWPKNMSYVPWHKVNPTWRLSSQAVCIHLSFVLQSHGSIVVQ